MISSLDKYYMHFDATAILSTTAVITTILLYISGALVVQKYIRHKSTGDSSCFPFICGFLSCSLWLKYAILTNEPAVIMVNTIGASLFFLYIMIFWLYTINKRAILRELCCVFVIIGLTIMYTQLYEQDTKKAITVVGYLCCLISVAFFAAPCCMFMKIVRLKSTEMLPFPLILMSFFVSVLWFLFGLVINDLFLQVPNLLGALLSGSQLCLFLIYPSKAVFNPNIQTTGDVPYAIMS